MKIQLTVRIISYLVKLKLLLADDCKLTYICNASPCFSYDFYEPMAEICQEIYILNSCCLSCVCVCVCGLINVFSTNWLKYIVKIFTAKFIL